VPSPRSRTRARLRKRIATSHAYDDRLIDELYRRVTTVIGDRCGSSPALEQWISDQRMTMRRPTGPIARLIRPAD